MRLKSIPVEISLLVYLLIYAPYVVLTRLVTQMPVGKLGRHLTGTETLPATFIISLILTFSFIWLSGWHKKATGVQLAAIRLPVPTIYTFLSGVGTALVLFTVPLSFTIDGVSIPFIQLLMRGDILIVAPLVDLMFRRKVRWWSWLALVVVLIALIIVVKDRGNLNLPPIAILTVVLYTVGFFIRLAVMTKVSKTGDDDSIQRYFVEEKIVAMPFAIIFLALIAAAGIGNQANQLIVGFFEVWTDPIIFTLALSAVLMTAIAILSLVILLDARENSYCVPLERSASILAGVIGAYLLALGWGLPKPSSAELLGAGLLIAAIILLSFAPRLAKTMNHG